MKPLCLFAVCATLFVARSAWANDPPAPPAWLAEFSIVPLALLIFAWSGAAKLFDESSGKRNHRRLVLILSVLVTLFSGAHEGFAFMFAPILGIYGVIVGIRMLNVSSLAPPHSFVRKASRWGGFVLIPLAIFLASFSVVFLNSHRINMGDNFIPEAMPKFYAFQKSYAETHDGKFLELRIEDQERADNNKGELFGKQWSDSDMFWFADFNGKNTQIKITYRSDMKSYQIKTRPIAFLPWPYRLFSPRMAFFMKEDGVIHFQRSWSSSTEATVDSPKY